MRFSSSKRRSLYLALASAVLLFCSVANATITLSTTTRAGTSATGTGTDIDCRGPCPVVIDAGSGTTSTHSTGDVEQVGIRFAEKKITNCDYTHNGGTLPTITCNNSPNLNSFTTLSWELNTASTSGGTDWTAYSGTGDANEYYHDGGTEVHGKPIGVRISGSDASEGTCCALTAGQWGWCNALTCDGGAAPNANRVTVQLSDNTDPDANPTATVQVLYGDGEYIEVSHSTWNSGNPVYVYVNDKTDDDTIVLAEAPTGASGDITDDTVTVFQAVNPWTDLRYNYSVSCPNGGGNCIEDITNGDQRPGLVTTDIDETVGHGPIWAFVFKEGFGSNATITVTAYDDANGDTTDSQTIDVDETSWGGGAEYFIDSVAGSESNDGSTAELAKAKWETGFNWLLAATPPATLWVARGSAFTLAANVDDIDGHTGDRRVAVYGSGATPTVACATFRAIGRDTNTALTASDFRISDITFTQTGSNTAVTIGADDTCFVRVSSTAGSGGYSYFIDAGAGATSGSLTSTDFIMWDCDGVTVGGNSYVMFGGGGDTAAEQSRRAFVGCNFSDTSGSNGESIFRVYQNNSVVAYCDMRSGGNNSKDVLRIASGGIAAEYNHVYANYFKVATADVCAIHLFQDSSTYHKHVVIEGNYVESLGSSAVKHGIEFDKVDGQVRITNNIFDGMTRTITASEGNGIGPVLFANNSVYDNRSANIWMVETAATTDFTNIKIINNAGYVPNSLGGGGGSVIVENNGSFGTVASTHMLENIVDWGAVVGAWQIGGASGGLTGAGWPAQTGKAAQLNYTGNQGKDNNPLFALPASNDFRLCTAAGTPDASCSGASPCIDAGWDLPTVYYDYSGAVRNSDDVGAWDDDAVIAATGACCTGLTCSVTTEAACTGSYKGDDTDCSPNPCRRGRGPLDKIFRPFGPFGYGYDDTGEPWGK